MGSFNSADYPTIALDDAAGEIVIIDQTLLPGEVRLLRLSKIEDIWEAIKTLRVRGAPAIGVTAAFAVYLAGKAIDTEDTLVFAEKFGEAADYLATSRPTAVNLFWALDRMRGVVADALEGGRAGAAGAAAEAGGAAGADKTRADEAGVYSAVAGAAGVAAEAGGVVGAAKTGSDEDGVFSAAAGAAGAATEAGGVVGTAKTGSDEAGVFSAAAGAAGTAAGAGGVADAAITTEAGAAITVREIKKRLLLEANAIRDEDIAICKAIGEHALGLLKPGMGLLTHCNAGRLATVEYGTATSAMYLGHEKGYGFSIYCDETRPLLQGARLTAFELAAAGLKPTVICDNMVSSLMAAGKIDAVFTGCDRVAANGDSANKIGTSGVAIIAKHYGVPFYICAPSSTLDMATPDGSGITIEQRAPEEVTEMWYEARMAPAEAGVYNPAFDVTDASLITAIITEDGVFHPAELKARYG